MNVKKLCLVIMLVSVILLCAVLGSCSSSKTPRLKDGYCTAEMDDFDSGDRTPGNITGIGHEGWKEYITIYVRNSRIITAECNAENESGLIKSW